MHLLLSSLNIFLEIHCVDRQKHCGSFLALIRSKLFISSQTETLSGTFTHCAVSVLFWCLTLMRGDLEAENESNNTENKCKNRHRSYMWTVASQTNLQGVNKGKFLEKIQERSYTRSSSVNSEEYNLKQECWKAWLNKKERWSISEHRDAANI